MSFKNLEDSIRALEDVNDAPKLRARIRKLEEELLEKDRVHAKEKEGRRSAYKTVESKYLELAKLRIEFKENRYSLRGIDRIVRERMDQKVKKNIDKQAQKLSQERMPSLIVAEIAGYPSSCGDVTRRVVGEKAAQLLDDYLRNPSEWPPWFKSKVSEEADKLAEKRMDQVFWTQVNERTDQEINQRLPGAWEFFLKTFATTFMKNTIQTQLLSLSVPIEYECPRCWETVQLTLTPVDLSTILRKGWISFSCPYCWGWLKPKFRLTLGELFMYIMKGDLKPIIHIKWKVKEQ